MVEDHLRRVARFQRDSPRVVQDGQTLGDRADYILVKNPARFRSHAFEQSALAKLFKKNRMPVLELPALTATTIQAIEIASAEKKKHLTFTEAVKLPSIHPMCRFEIEHFLNRVFTQCEDAARVLVPESATIKNKVYRPTDKAGPRPIDEFNPLDDL